MKIFAYMLTCSFIVTGLTACEPTRSDVTMTFSRDTVINGIETQKIFKTGQVRQLTGSELDSIDEILSKAEVLTGSYVSRKANEDTVAYLDRVLTRWKKDTLTGKVTDEQICHAIAILFGQAMVDNKNFEWTFFDGELMIHEQDDLAAEFPSEISRAMLQDPDTNGMQKRRLAIMRNVGILKQMKDLDSKN